MLNFILEKIEEHFLEGKAIFKGNYTLLQYIVYNAFNISFHVHIELVLGSLWIIDIYLCPGRMGTEENYIWIEIQWYHKCLKLGGVFLNRSWPFFWRSRSRNKSNTLNLNCAKTINVIVLIFLGVLDLPLMYSKQLCDCNYI